MAMESLSHAVVVYVLNAAWQVPVIVSAALLGAFSLRRGPARYQNNLWQIALTACLILPLIAAVTVAAASGDGSPGSQESAHRSMLWVVSIHPPVMWIVTAAALLAAAIRAVQLLRGLWTIRVLVANARPACERVAMLRAGCESVLGLSPVPVVFIDNLAGPATVGIRRPVVLLPGRFATGDDEVLMARLVTNWPISAVAISAVILSTNCCFVRSRFIRWHSSSGKLNQTCEMACDETVGKTILDRRRYARCLVAIAAGDSHTPMPSVAMNGNGHEGLKERIHRLVAPREIPSRGGIAPITATVSLLLTTGFVQQRAA